MICLLFLRSSVQFSSAGQYPIRGTAKCGDINATHLSEWKVKCLAYLVAARASSYMVKKRKDDFDFITIIECLVNNQFFFHISCSSFPFPPQSPRLSLPLFYQH